MLDCPEASHTSPTSTSVRRILFFRPLMAITCGLLLAGMAFSVTCHLPSLSAVVLSVCLPNDTFTFSPASATPQMLTGFSLWSTMWLLNASATFTSACVVAASVSMADIAIRIFFMLCLDLSFWWQIYGISHVHGELLVSKMLLSIPSYLS